MLVSASDAPMDFWMRRRWWSDVLVTGDADLPSLNPFEGIPILTPADYLGRI
jgi:hypothetical protein